MSVSWTVTDLVHYVSKMPSMLLKNGTALIHDANDHVDAVVTDILIEGDKICKIAKDISAPGAEVMDCSDKLISPGWVVLNCAC